MSGGSSGQVKYENLEKLYDIQAQQGQQLMDMANRNVYPAYESMMEEAKGTGSIANQEKAATQAAADMQAGLGGAKAQLSENLASMGVNASDPRYANTMARMELEGAAQGAGAQTAARERTKAYGAARLKDAVSMGMGLPSDAASALNSAGGFASSAANMQMQQAQMDQNSRSNIASLAGRFLFADGGPIRQRLKCGGMVKGYASGGILGAMQSIKPPAPPASAPARSSSSGLLSGASNAAVGQGGSKLGGYIEKAGNALGSGDVSSFGAGMRLGKDAAPAIEAYKGAAQAAGDTALGAKAAADAAYAAAPGVAEGAITEAGAGMAGEALGTSLAAGETAGTLASTGAALGAGSAVAAALPWVGGALLIGSALGLFKDGGSINKHRLMAADGTQGGAVKGPGGPKDDLVPIMGSNGEFMLPVGTVKLYGEDVLERMRQEGLAYEKKMGLDKEPAGQQPVRGYALGGIIGGMTSPVKLPADVERGDTVAPASKPAWGTAYSIGQMIGSQAISNAAVNGMLGEAAKEARQFDAMPAGAANQPQGYDGPGSNQGGGEGLAASYDK